METVGIALGSVAILFVLIDIAFVRVGDCMRRMAESGWEDEK